MEILRARRDLDIGLDEERRLAQLKVAVGEGERRSKRMEREFDQIVARWQSKVEMVKRGIEEEHKLARGKVAAEIAERLVTQVQEKNRQQVEIQKVKEEVET